MCCKLKPAAAFNPDPSKRSGLTSRCRKCNKKYLREYYNQAKATESGKAKLKNFVDRYRKSEKGQRTRRNYELRTRYGITIEQFEEMERCQNNQCAICGGPPYRNISLHVDHVHSTGQVRGLLCHFCNMGIAQFEEDIERLQSAIDYLKEHA